MIAPGKHPRVTLTPTLALKDGLPFLSFAVQGGDSQDQNLLQFFLNIVEFGMTPQQAAEAPNINSYQMRSSFGAHESGRGTCSSRRARRTACGPRCREWDIRSISRSGRRDRSTPFCSIGPRNHVGRIEQSRQRTTELPGKGTR